jgi:hypothetical protein
MAAEGRRRMHAEELRIARLGGSSAELFAVVAAGRS